MHVNLPSYIKRGRGKKTWKKGMFGAKTWLSVFPLSLLFSKCSLLTVFIVFLSFFLGKPLLSIEEDGKYSQWHTQSALHISGFCIHKLNQLQNQNTHSKINGMWLLMCTMWLSLRWLYLYWKCTDFFPLSSFSKQYSMATIYLTFTLY